MAFTKNMIIAVCFSVMALSAVKGNPLTTKPVSSPSLMTQYLREMCSFYAKEKEFPGIGGCNPDVIEDVKEHADNLDRPRQYIPNWDGDMVEVYLNMAKRSNIVCKAQAWAQGAPIKGACAVMEAACTSKENIMPCSMVTVAPPTASPTAPATTPSTTTPTMPTTTSVPAVTA